MPKRLGTVSVVGTASGIGTNEARTTALTTTGTNELLLAFAGADGPKSTGSQSLTVSGGGLTWSLVRRANTEAGDAEIWSATAPGPLSGATFSAKAAASGYDTSLTVAAVTGAAGIGSSAAAGAASGAPIVSMTAGNAGSEFFATGDDWDNAVKRTLAPGQALLSEYLDTGGGDTYWTQYAESSSGMPGETVTLSDTAPTKERWNLAAVEVLGGGAAPPPPAEETPVVSITNPVLGETLSGSVPVSATATNNGTISSVQFYLDGKPLGAPVTKAPYATTWETASAANGTYVLTATATDATGQVGTPRASKSRSRTLPKNNRASWWTPT